MYDKYTQRSETKESFLLQYAGIQKCIIFLRLVDLMIHLGRRFAKAT